MTSPSMTSRWRATAPVGRESIAGRHPWRHLGGDLLLLGAGLSWASIWAASCIAAPFCLATRRRDRTASGRDAGDDLLSV